MQRNLRIERLYTLGNFQNLKVFDEIEGIPEDLAKNKEVIDKLYFIMLINADKTFFRYKTLLEKTANHKTCEDVIIELNSLRDQTLQDLENLLTKKEN